MVDLEKMETEKRNPNSINLDQMSVKEAVTLMNNEDKKVTEAIEEVIPEIEQAVHTITQQLRKGGRLIYMGAGTSGRLGVLDAAECPPTFGTSPKRVVGLIAGGENAFTEAIEGAEDSEELGKSDLIALDITKKDVIVGLAASGRTPYVIGGLNYADELNLPTIAIACNKKSEIGKVANIAIEAVPGPEVLTGSTRLKAGSTQKMILNILSTLSMVGLGKVYENLMVDVQPTNKKLLSRAENILMEATGVERNKAKETLEKSGRNVKTAILMILLNINQEEANKKLEETNGHIRKTL
ncbi:MAG: N-acetylmuramic acid 6-phosphate etherase [Atopostipes sp.]|nr:N-acetylmuramic acid 6-phosphate etherase [Atopostipes sp.]